MRRVLLVIVLLVVGAWTAFLVLVLPGNFVAGTTPFGVGLAITTFVLGMRHAFDADHIAAIDNSTRKLVSERRDASTVGLWFALGHSTVVVIAVALISAGIRLFVVQLGDHSSPMMIVAGYWGPLVSSFFLLGIGAVNLVALLRVVRRSSGPDRPVGGFVSAMIRRGGAVLDRPWKMFSVGLLFGLGFDTASTVGLVLVAQGGGVGLPWYVGLILPLLFTAGMVACDGLNGLLVARAYAWSVRAPASRVTYNVLLMAASVLIALAIGVIGLCGFLVDELHFALPPLEVLARANGAGFGVVVAGALLGLWALCFGIYQRDRRRRFR